MSSQKVILAGPEVLFDFFKSNFSHWDFQVPCSTVDAVWEGLNNETLAEDTGIVILCDSLYHDNHEAFAELAANLAPEALLLILSYEEQYQSDISSDILAHPLNVKYRKEYGKSLPFEFIFHETAIVSIDEAVDFHFNQAQAVEDFKRSSAAVDIAVDETSSNHHMFNKKGKVITVTSSKGGSGKSTVAFLLGATLGLSSQRAVEQGLIEEPLRVCVVDLDTFDGQLGFTLNQAMPTSLNIALASSAIDPELIWNNLIYTERAGFHALLAPVRGITARYTDARFYIEVISHLRKMFDVIILDTSVQHYDPIIKTVALPEADAVLFVTTLDIKSVKGMARWMKNAAEDIDRGGHELNMEKVGVVVNSSIHGVGIGKDELTHAALNRKLIVSIPLETKTIQVATNRGRMEEVLKIHPELSEAYFQLASSMSGLTGGKLVSIYENGKEDEEFNATQVNPRNKNVSNGGNKVAPPARPANDTKPKKRGFFGRK